MTAPLRSEREALEVAESFGRRFALQDARRDAERVYGVQELADLAASGLLAITVPREYGGLDASAHTVGRVIAALATGDSSLGQIPQNHFFFVEVLRHAAEREQKQFFFSEVLAGKRFGNALSERGTPTARDYAITFERGADGRYLVDGTKYYATGSPGADWIPIYANDPEGRLHAAWIPAHDPGVTVVDDWRGMGQRTTGSGTVRFQDVHIPASYVVPAWTIFEKEEVFAAFGNYLHAAVDTGIAAAALRDGRTCLHELARPWWEAEVERAVDEPGVVQQFGELALRVRGARALLDAAGDAIDVARADLTLQTAAEASAAVAAARAFADHAAVSVSSDVFALIGTRSAAEDLNLHRHWRNARTHTLHDPRRWKVFHLGAWELSDTPPPRNGIS